MNRASAIKPFSPLLATTISNNLFHAFLFGLFLPISFAPFHFPGAAIIGLAFFYAQLCNKHNQHSFLYGLFFGLGYFGLGISWVFVSIHEYGHLNYILSASLTLLFLVYLSLFIAFMALIFKKLVMLTSPLLSCLLFSALWILFEYFRSICFSGFPWLLIGYGQFDAPFKYLLPIVGVFGVGFLTCFVSTLLAVTMQQTGIQRCLGLLAFVALVLSPALLKNKQWSQPGKAPISVGIIQANLSMRDKWNERLLWQILRRYKHGAEKLLGTQLIVMPESAIPLPQNYLTDFLNELNTKALQAGSAIMLGIPQPTEMHSHRYFNALISLGGAKGTYLKQHLVPFGEYIPKPLQSMSNWLNLPDSNLKPGNSNQELVTVHQHGVATLICYELAYGTLLRQQLPQAEWIVSISDDGWFGHSLAMYQQQQMSQVRALETSRYHVVANNDGLSSVINAQGEIVDSLPAFRAGLIKTTLFPMTGLTPWVQWGNAPTLLFCSLFVFGYTIWTKAIAASHKRRYSYRID